VVLHDLLGLTDWQPPFAPPMGKLADPLTAAAARWIEQVQATR
jgi:ketopantoate hydroxymethyltransferase